MLLQCQKASKHPCTHMHAAYAAARRAATGILARSCELCHLGMLHPLFTYWVHLLVAAALAHTVPVCCCCTPRHCHRTMHCCREKAKSAWHSSSKTAGVVGTALPLAIICPPAAAPAVYGAALAYDASHSAVSGHKKGLVAAYGRILKGESNPGEVHDVLFRLGSMGAGVALAETGAVTTSAAATGADAAAAAAAVETTRAAVGSAAADAAAGAAAEQQSLLQEAVAATSQEAAGAADTAGPKDQHDARGLATMAGQAVAKKVVTSVSYASAGKQGVTSMKGA